MLAGVASLEILENLFTGQNCILFDQVCCVFIQHLENLDKKYRKDMQHNMREE